jgi:hypothetical protein
MTPLYQRILGTTWNDLSPQIRALHDVRHDTIVHGIGQVRRGTNLRARILATLLSLPCDGDDLKLSVRFTPSPEGDERWERHFGSHRFVSTFHEHNGLLEEKIRFITLRFALVVQQGSLAMQIKEMFCFGIPCGQWLHPHIVAEETERDGCFHLRIEAALPLFGTLVHYSGRLEKLTVTE